MKKAYHTNQKQKKTYVCLRDGEGVGSLGATVEVSYEHLTWVLGTKLQFSEKATTEPSPKPQT